jgi:hypothetical protein
MRLALGLATLALATGCGGSSGIQHLTAQPPTGGQPPATQAPVVGAPLPGPVGDPTRVPDRTMTPVPIGVVADPTAAYAGGGTATSGTATSGTASSGPGRRTSPAATPAPRPTPTAVSGTVTVTDNDSGTTVRLHRGQHLRVRLSSGTWDPPVSSSDGVVVRRSSSGGYPSNDPVDATFHAVGNGTADVTAQSDASCFHTQPRCLMASRQWQVRVTVA